MKKKIERKYNLKNKSQGLKLEAPESMNNNNKDEKIIGFDDFQTNDSKDDFASFPDAFTDGWDKPSSSKKKKEKEDDNDAF